MVLASSPGHSSDCVAWERGYSRFFFGEGGDGKDVRNVSE